MCVGNKTRGICVIDKTYLSIKYEFNFLLEQFISKKRLSARQDSNLHPSQSGWVPLPLDHLHSMISPCFNSYPRAFCCVWSMTLTLFGHVPCYVTIYLGGKCTCTSWKMLMHMCLDGLPSSSKYMCSQIAYMNQIWF